MADTTNGIAKVDGILILNDNVRKEMLRKVYWKDKQYTDFGNGDYVTNPDIENRDVKPLGNGKDLLTYTYDNLSDYSKEILKENLSNEVNHKIFENRPISNDERWKWDGNYLFNFNPNSKLYQVGQIKLSEGEIRNLNANEERHLEQKYITPKLLGFYGNKITAQYGIMQYTLDGRMDGIVNAGTGRMADIAEADVYIVHDINKFLKESRENLYEYAKNSNAAITLETPVRQYLAKTIENAKKENSNFKTPDNQYVVYESVNDLTNIPDSEEHVIPLRGVIDNEKDFSHTTYGQTSGRRIYDEKDSENVGSTFSTHTIKSDGKETFNSIDYKRKSLLTKTNKLFNEHKIATMIGRFHISEGVGTASTLVDSAKSKYGNSHGRNLLTKKAETGSPDKTNDYENPYCRVWTYHHQYDKVSRLIRHGNIEDYQKGKPYSAIYPNSTSVSDGATYLKDNTVLGENGFVNIAPKANKFCGGGKEVTNIKKCMFSIENLAWKDVPRKSDSDFLYISDEQRGPNGGRIMWFPPYDLDFQENVQVNWNQNTFIGRGEPVFTYANTNRSGTLSFSILVDHPSIIDNIGKNNLKENGEITESDILRFFAGCGDVPDMTNKAYCDKLENIETEPNKKDSDEPVQTTNKEKAGKIVFYVFFPNNYSGYQTKAYEGNGEIVGQNNYSKGPTDRLWFDYLLMGKNNIIPKNVADIIGYEMSADSGHGLSTEEKVDNPVYSSTSPWEEGSGTIIDGLWYSYRVDFDSHQKLENIMPNKESRGMDLEKSNYFDNKSYKLNKEVNYKEKEQSGATHSFAQIMCALSSINNSLLNDENYFSKNFNKEGIVTDDELLNVLRQSDGYKITDISINGCATSQDSPNTSKLAERRKATVKELLGRYIELNEKNCHEGIIEVGKLKNPTDDNTLEAKAQRSVVVEINYNTPEIGANSAANNTQNSARTENVAQRIVQVETQVSNPTRYENESEYFKQIEKTDPLLYKNLITKFKYFNPAFHSISPEGFNARLTFLQQCTRQGHTIEASNTNGFAKTAGNLAFGKMPVCVLRLGDFLNTKIIINGYSVSYGSSGPMQWDLNPEGIGVQPMYAKVSLQITILGGQSLEGPINRLQNAVTFNYYANTGVYDNRSDRISIDTNYVKTTNGEDNVVRIQSDGTKVYDNSEYARTNITYRNIFTPYPITGTTRD